ncbi:LOW QUALITY PROTEIN: E3 ubiquitin-protein ligase HUWE1 [Daphnia magna]|uniref:LOW QUALITY PROTEIN: E3 ubiquitin-protein ligase HUWE1 n=1 Tax=Daphnia magna TaxID=35525 RepID=UPI001E1BC341|nr:LOW QUALITY PROTEIN: E3 ubiquitin-protein ligase HUWE1 [Daphnia magna]
MKIDRSKLKKSSSEVPADCKALIERLKSCSEDELLVELKKIETWTYGKCELYHWVDVLDLCDSILERACHKEHENSWVLTCDLPQNKQLKELLLWTLHFTTLLIEHSFSRHLYNSMEHLTSMLSSNCLNVVLGVLNLLYMFSKRSNFISRLASERRVSLLSRLTYLAESWGGKENGFGLAECCKDLPLSSYPSSATTLHFEFYAESMGDGSGRQSGSGKSSGSFVTVIHVEHVEWLNKSPAQLMEELIELHHVPLDKQMQLFTHIRLAHAFSDYRRRLQCVQARLQALSVLIYCNALADAAPSLLYAGLLEELVDVLELTEPQLMEIRAAALRTLTAIIHLDRNPNFPKLNTIIDVTGAALYHGFLPVLVRSCIASLTGQHTEQDVVPFPLPLATALFSFLYHLASYEAGGEALVACGMMESLLRVVSWPGSELEHITFVTRAVRVIDLITNLDMHAFQAHGGLQIFINRLESEVDACRKEQPYEIRPPVSAAAASNAGVNIPGDEATNESESEMEVDIGATSISSSAGQPLTEPIPGVTCLPQRAALLKSMLNFLKKAIQDASFSDSIRHVMDGSLPAALKHIISNAEYYGPSLFLLGTDVVTVYVFQEPSLLSSLQDSGLTDVVLHALLVKDVPATREVLGSLPNVFSALCLNTRGLASFVACKPFQRLFKVLLSPDYLPAMRRRRSSDPMGDTATNLGNAMDELMRHQPSLRTDATAGIIQLLEELCALGHDPNYIASSRTQKFEAAQSTSARTGPVEATGGGSSDEEEDEEEEATSSSNPAPPRGIETETGTVVQSEKTPVPLVDYVLNVMKFVDAILSNNSTDDHCREFVSQRGLIPLMGILGLPNLPVDFPVTPACQAVAAVCKSILNLAHEPLVLKQGLDHLQTVLNTLQQLHKPLDPPGGSVLLRELASSSNPTEAITSPNTTPLLHAMAAAHAYIMMFVHVCRTGQSDIRTLSINHWGSPIGLPVLKGLSKLYTSLVWESTVLLALCSDETLPLGCQFGRADLEKLLPPELKAVSEGPSCSGVTGMELGTNSVAAALQALSTEASPPAAMEVDHDQLDAKDRPRSEKLTPAQQYRMKMVKPLLSTASRLGRALAELFGLLVKLCVGSPIRHRRAHQAPPTPIVPSPSAQAVAGALTQLLTSGLAWEPPVTSPTPKFRLTFLICSVGFTSPMLFDEKKLPYHLMLHKFVSCGGQAAFFDAFYWALSAGGRVPLDQGLEYADLPEGTGEFLDAWLMLLEKMVNPKNILDSPHQLPNKALHGSKQPFSPLKYLISTHRQAFDAVMKLWGKRPLKVYGARMTESVLTILCHILKGEVIIQEKLTQEKAEEPAAPSGVATSASSGDNVTTTSPAVGTSNPAIAALGEAATGSSMGARRPTVDRPGAESDADLVNPQHLQALMDMGFPRDQCVEALLFTTSLEQATDYLLSTPPSLLRAAQGAVAAAAAEAVSTAMDTDGNDEDAVMRAIALSLTADSDRTDETVAVEKEHHEHMLYSEPLSKQVLDQFVQQALDGCLSLLDSLPETVYRVCSLVVAMVQRNGEAYRDSMLASLAKEIGNCVTSLQDHLDGVDNLVSKADAVIESSDAMKASVRIHLFTLLCEEMKMACARQLEEKDLVLKLIRLLSSGQQVLAVKAKVNEGIDCKSVDGIGITPKWIAPLLLCLDLYEKMSLGTRRRASMEKVTSHVWKWFDIVSGKWCPYTAANNKIIDDAFWAGQNSVRVTAGRRRYLLQFSSMIQVNEETGNRRPMMLSLKEKPKEAAQDESSSVDENAAMDVDENEKESPKGSPLSGLNLDQGSELIKSCVGLLCIPADPDTLHAAMRLCLRLTRHYQHAEKFASLGGVKQLLNLSQSSTFSGFLTLATLLLRHLVEEPETLHHTMEKVIRAYTGPNAAPSTKEFHFLMRVLAPAACRDVQLFSEVCKTFLRADLSLTNKRGDEEDNRLLMKALPPRPGCSLPQLSGVAREIVCDLLDALTIPVPPEETATPLPTSEGDGATPVTVPPARRFAGRNVRQQELIRNSSSSDLLNHEAEETVDDASRRDSLARKKESTSSEEMDRRRRPLLPKSAICRLLAELVRSYAGCARLVAEHIFPAKTSELVSEETSALAFLLDNLLPSCQTAGDKDSPALVRTLVASLASCNHAPEAQSCLVAEVKGALNRALTMPESNDKHNRLQSLTALLSTMIESCPATGLQPQQPLTTAFKQQNLGMNNMVKFMLKRGLVNDLARIPHCLDMSSPLMAFTVNAALKPLEALSRIVNLPPAAPVAGRPVTKPKSGDEGEPQESSAQLQGTSTSDNTRAQAVEISNALDAENTEQDVSAAGESLENLADNEGGGESGDNNLEDIMDQHSQALVEALIVAAENPSQMETDDSAHDSQMRTHNESEFIGADDAHYHGNDPRDSSDSDSQSESGHSEDDDDEADDDDDDDDGGEEETEEEGEGEDDVEEEEEETEAEEGEEENASGYGEDSDRYPEMLRDFLTRGAAGAGADVEDTLVFTYPDAENSAAGLGFGAGLGLGRLGAGMPLFLDDTFRSHMFPYPLLDEANGNEAAVGSGTASMSRLNALAHPLLVGRQSTVPEGSAAAASSRNRGGRQRGYRYLQTNSRVPNPPAILQRLLGPSATHDVLQLTGGQTLGFGRESRVFLVDNGLGILANPEDEALLDIQDQMGGVLVAPGIPSGLVQTPSALNRWMEEAIILDADSIHDCITALKPEILAIVEKQRDEELSERRERRKKQQEEETSRRRKEEENDQKEREKNKDVTPSPAIPSSVASSIVPPPVTMEVAQLETTASVSETPSFGSFFHGFNMPSVSNNTAITSTPLVRSNDHAETLATSIVEAVLGPALETVSGQSRSQPTDNRDHLESTPTSVSSLRVQSQTTAVTPVESTVQPTVPVIVETPANSGSFSTAHNLMSTIQRMQSETTPNIDRSSDHSTTPFNPIPNATPGAPRVSVESQEELHPFSTDQVQFIRRPLSFQGEITPMRPTDESFNMGLTAEELRAQSDLEVRQGTNMELGASSGMARADVSGASALPPVVAGGSDQQSGEYQSLLGNIEIPEGVDPSFLAALPEDMRQEVIAEQLRLQRLRQRARAQATDTTNQQAVLEVSAEFLAALPPNIQEEVLAQQRLEQQRTVVPANPNEPVDPADFLSTLPPALRQSILADMEDSQMAVLPPELAAEAQNLRREWEARNRQLMTDRFFTHVGNSGANALSSIIRNSMGRLGSRYGVHPVHNRGHWGGWGRPVAGASGSSAVAAQAAANGVRLRGRHLLDHEALSCLLVLLFIDEPKLNTTRLHRVLRNLCYHGPTRDWVVKSLLSILERSNEARANAAELFPITSTPSTKGKRITSRALTATPPSDVKHATGVPSWLNISLDAALGCRANVFHILKPSSASGVKKQGMSSSITIHSQAAPIICRHTLDVLISLAKSFPSHFLPRPPLPGCEDKKDKDVDTKKGTPIAASSTKKQELGTDFWDLLARLDSQSASRKGKGLARTHSGATTHGVASATVGAEEEIRHLSLESSPFGQLLALLSSSVVRRSSLLTDRLLRLLSLISLGLPDSNTSAPAQQQQQLHQQQQQQRRHSEGVRMRDWERRELHSSLAVQLQQQRDTALDLSLPGIEASPQDLQLLEQHLKLAVDVLTSKSCSEEGLEDATSLLLSLSYGPPPTRDTILKLLLDGARELGNIVCSHIRALLNELHTLRRRPEASTSAASAQPVQSGTSSEEVEADGVDRSKGFLMDRFTKDMVVVAAQTKPKTGGYELQLPSMGSLTSKTSSQAFFLRILKVILQLRDAARLAAVKAKRKQVEATTQAPTTAASSSTSAVGTEPTIPSETLISEASGVAASVGASTGSEASAEVTNEIPATPMEVDEVNSSRDIDLPRLSQQLLLDSLWNTLSECLQELADTPDHHAVLVLQPAVEAFFLVHAAQTSKEEREKRSRRPETRESQLSHLQQEIGGPGSPSMAVQTSNDDSLNQLTLSMSSAPSDLPPDTQKFLSFAERHRTVLNQILRQSTTHLADGPFAVLVDHTRVLDFDVKRRYFRTELERADAGIRREDLAVHVKREHVFEDSFRELHRRSPEEWKNRFYIVFEGEEGQDAGGLLREWYVIISREIFNPMYALFSTSPGDRVTYMINALSHCNSNHLCYFKFVGRVIAKAIYDNKLLECYFTRSFYKHILGKCVRYTDMESEDYSFYQGLAFLIEHEVTELGYDLTFSTEVQEFGVTEARDLKPNGRNIIVTEENKMEYIRLVCQMKMTGAIRKQLNAFLEGFYDIIPKRLISIFNEQELELLLSGLPNIDIDDLKANSEYHKYQPTSLQIQWFWRALRSFDQADRAKFLQFVTGTSKVPLQGFSALEGMNGVQKFQIHRDDRSTDRLPSAHTCFNQLDLPAYETYDKLRTYLLKAIHECSEGFGFA